jgi:hypothetical protein
MLSTCAILEGRGSYTQAAFALPSLRRCLPTAFKISSTKRIGVDQSMTFVQLSIDSGT